GLVAVLSGAVAIEGREVAAEAVAVLDRDGDRLRLTGMAPESRVLLLTGEPIDEPIAAMGPFVMNTHEELIRAVEDYRRGRMGTL
ncbi:MAG: pirin family protein, partial [Phyllobacteriaceae bacterium]|nr:pirin family protein [Phyllobacteriaceae bacterium]